MSNKRYSYHREIAKVLGALCQEPGTKTKYISYYTHNGVNIKTHGKYIYIYIKVYIHMYVEYTSAWKILYMCIYIHIYIYRYTYPHAYS